MKTSEIILTDSDKLVLESYGNFMDGLASYFGSNVEIVLHSLEDIEHSVIKIINGFHTDRHVGAPITDLALNMLRNIEEADNGKDYISYFSTNSKGEPLKSITILIRGEEQRIIGVLCMNIYMSAPLIDVLKVFGIDGKVPVMNETFIDSTDRMIRKSVLSATKIVEKSKNIHPSIKNKAIIGVLYDRKIFNLKNSVDIVADELGISKNTVYLHIRNIKG